MLPHGLGSQLVLQVEQGSQHGPSQLIEGGGGGQGQGACSLCKCIPLSRQTKDGDGPMRCWEEPGKRELCPKIYRMVGVHSVQVWDVMGERDTVWEASKSLGLRHGLLPLSFNEVVSIAVH